MARAARANNRFDKVALIVCAGVSLIVLTLPMPVREPIAGALRRTLLAPAVALQERAELSRRAFLDHESVMQQRGTAALDSMDVGALRSENERLRAVIGLGARLKWGFVPAEALYGRGISDETSVTLSAGSNAGVQRMNPVVAPEGLVGVVDNVDPTMSHAQLWTNPEFRVSAMSEDGSAFGIVQAHVSSGPGKYMLEMRGVPFRTAMKPGTLVVSSGLGGVYPRGIPIGRVSGEIRTNETWARTYLIRPAVFPGDVYSVMILRAERAAEGVQGVWAVGSGTESATQAIVTAGDSMARAAALAESRARQAAQDSAALRDSTGALLHTPGTLPPQGTTPPAAPTTRPATPPASATPRDTMRRPSARDTLAPTIR